MNYKWNYWSILHRVLGTHRQVGSHPGMSLKLVIFLVFAHGRSTVPVKPLCWLIEMEVGVKCRNQHGRHQLAQRNPSCRFFCLITLLASGFYLLVNKHYFELIDMMLVGRGWYLYKQQHWVSLQRSRLYDLV